MTEKVILSEVLGDAVEYDALTGTYRKKMKPLQEVDTPGSEYWNALGQPRRQPPTEEDETE